MLPIIKCVRCEQLRGAFEAKLLKKDGYDDYSSAFKRNENLNIVATVFAVLIIPALWIMDYKPIHSYELVPKVSQVNK